MQGLQNSVRNLNFIPMESTETPLQQHSNSTPWSGNGVEFQKLCRISKIV